jgi:hypothetical protein
MKANSKLFTSILKDREILIMKIFKEMTGKYELPSKWTLANSIKESEEGYKKLYINSEAEFYSRMVDIMILYRLTFEDLGKAIMAYNELRKIELKGEKFIIISFENDQFVLKLGFEPDEKSEMELGEFIKEVCVA